MAWPLDPVALAVRAHRIETGLGWQAGVQDQHAAAHGGAARIFVNYPDAVHERLVVPDSAWAALGERLITVYVGRPHSSSAVHEQVIARLESVESEPLLAPLRLAASRAARALEIGDLAAWGEALVANTDAQAALDPRLIGDDMHRLIAIARRHGAAGWKVNGAGGDGGSVTLLGPVERDRHAALIRAVDATPGWTRLGLTPTTRGVHLSD